MAAGKQKETGLEVMKRLSRLMPESLSFPVRNSNSETDSEQKKINTELRERNKPQTFPLGKQSMLGRHKTVAQGYYGQSQSWSYICTIL